MRFKLNKGKKDNCGINTMAKFINSGSDKFMPFMYALIILIEFCMVSLLPRH